MDTIELVRRVVVEARAHVANTFDYAEWHKEIKDLLLSWDDDDYADIDFSVSPTGDSIEVRYDNSTRVFVVMVEKKDEWIRTQLGGEMHLQECIVIDTPD